MRQRSVFSLLVAGGMFLAACAPAAQPAPRSDAPTAAPAKPAEPAKAAAPAKPAEPAKPAAEAKPAAKVDPKAIEDFYKGKNVKIIVGFAAGGGYDVYARLISRHLGKHIPGNPNIIVENMEGAGSLLAANSVYETAPKDGTTMVTFIGGMITQKIIVDNPNVRFDPLQFNWIGGPTPDTAACAVTKASGFTNLEQARTKELIVGGTAPGSTTDDIPAVLKTALGLNIKKVSGYGGTSKIRLAAESGEVHGGCWGWESIKPTWQDGLSKGEVVILAQGGPKPHPELKDVPMLSSFAKTDEERRLIEAGITAPGQISRTYALPPGVPADRVQAMRDAFVAVLKDPELLADAEKSKNDINPVSYQEFYERIKALQDLPADIKAKLKAAIET